MAHPTPIAATQAQSRVAAKYILATLAAVFLTLAAVRIVRDGGRIMPASRTWLLTGIIFGLVSGYLWMSV